MPETRAPHTRRAAARSLVDALQHHLVSRLEGASTAWGAPVTFQPVTWQRDAGRHGGGIRFVNENTPAYNRASVNVSAVHYDDLPEKRVASATALSAIIHPAHPRAPSMHTHISWTERRSGDGWWRVMADLNPSIPNPSHTDQFVASLARLGGGVFADATARGDRYFSIPALNRRRGVAHFYLEGHDSGDFGADLDFARSFGMGIIDTYGQLLLETMTETTPAPAQDRAAQLAYHTLYLFQVLTLDRGTTSGLLVHSDNDVGIMGSLPSSVDRDLLLSWAPLVPPPQDNLVRQIVDILPATSPSPLSGETRRALAGCVRAHYQAHPEALALQASGELKPSPPPTSR